MRRKRFSWRSERIDRRLCWAAATGILVLPGVGTLLKATMLSHMLVQIPALVVCGLLAGTRLHRAGGKARDLARAFRWPLLACALGTLTLWMIPRLLDEAVADPIVDALKVLSLVAGAGLPLALCWPHLGPVARGVIHLEALATCWRLGWLYLDNPQRLCAQYLLQDQQQLGTALLLLGVPYAAWLGLRALFGPAVFRLQPFAAGLYRVADRGWRRSAAPAYAASLGVSEKAADGAPLPRPHALGSTGPAGEP